MGIPSDRVQARQFSSNGSGSPTNSGFIIASSVIIGFLCLLVVLYIILRTLRAKNYSPKYIPTKFLKQKWNNWTPNRVYAQVLSEGARDADSSYPPTRTAQNRSPLRMLSNSIRRNTSIRSIMTLPSYSPTPKPEEEVISRAGEREGMDIVVEFPETADEEEARREEEMDSLYRIRQRRQQETQERDERRRQRREARAQGDVARLEQLRREDVARRSENNSETAAVMLVEHLSRGRDRRVSAVSYAALGEVRHDGSRIRANSAESDQRPLLEAAATISTADGRNSTYSVSASAHSRGYSGSSVLSTTSTLPGSPDANSLRLITSRTSGHGDGDLGAAQISPPPDYEHLEWGDAPEYESPVRERARETFPAIRISMATPEPQTPVSALTPPTSNGSSSENHTPNANASSSQSTSG